MTFHEWQAYAGRINARAKAVSDRLIAEARQEGARAGLDPGIVFLHAHNALVSREYGHPWPEVDYARVRRVRWLERRAWEPGRLAERIIQRAWQRVPHA